MYKAFNYHTKMLKLWTSVFKESYFEFNLRGTCLQVSSKIAATCLQKIPCSIKECEFTVKDRLLTAIFLAQKLAFVLCERRSGPKFLLSCISFSAQRIMVSNGSFTTLFQSQPLFIL